jgi:NTP pyrophosphatase (non-canonical NTP hydrolase)
MLTKAELYMIRGRANLTGRTRALRDHTIEVLRADSRALLADLDTMDEALRRVAEILAEREAQDQKWGEQNHDPETWVAILTEEVGEFSQAVLHWRFGGHASSNLRVEAIQTAAVALAIVECCDRNDWLRRAAEALGGE